MCSICKFEMDPESPDARPLIILDMFVVIDDNVIAQQTTAVDQKLNLEFTNHCNDARHVICFFCFIPNVCYLFWN